MSSAGPYYPPPGLAPYPPRRRIRWLPIILGVILAGVALVLLLVLLYPSAFGYSYPAYPDRFGFGGIFIAFFILIVVFFIVRVAFWSTRASRYGRGYGGRGGYGDGGPGGNYGANRPARIARMRYARGEITKEQYDQIMRDLGRRPGAP
jgi:uncharacterized membrane protein